MPVETIERIFPIPEPVYTKGHLIDIDGIKIPVITRHPTWFTKEQLPKNKLGKPNFSGKIKVCLYGQVLIKGHGLDSFIIMDFSSSEIVKKDYLKYIPQGTIGY
ncbi:MAG: hypothetical protein UR52_C0032G0002 [Candidatus Gottesmanbacteria bacterium GW2011_GWA1_34_13]|uniref:Uncharacterized protein n=1 Tax=Candidatus Gottesmanbacteria bacterium GW2011_GWA1_34_13 TaxID=1618434 RepID=A0A0G0AKR3_9BACT|nr:MAG: hypothetical protein UR52_C0032G0002 [Candidatus Gottesmanbacteria bacterium GW2011_GWA1_34_13]